MQGTVKEVVAERFVREAPALQPLPTVRYDTAYHERRQVAWDGYIDVRGNRYSVPSPLVGQTVAVQYRAGRVAARLRRGGAGRSASAASRDAGLGQRAGPPPPAMAVHAFG